MIITARLRRMILQRSQRGLTEVWYFIGLHVYPNMLRRFKVTAEQPPEGGNLLTLAHRRLQLLPYS
jgi:hypothetical protein